MNEERKGLNKSRKKNKMWGKKRKGEGGGGGREFTIIGERVKDGYSISNTELRLRVFR